ncbi:hypothetical protein P43SY_003290 [Pythium insidiosum]|uniref:Gamma-soluble NSF attachment protein n=1 Tax=Pythium insidiosum TaxID=114742 RepID=A0AAD5LWK7_PYTIN|nr:hypothetical protein P43SY_003290 [Pythium insidiosum]
MSALQEKKRKEAEEQMKQAAKYMEKTMFRWHPDYLAAAPCLEKAADAFRAAGELERAKKAFSQAAEVQNKNKSPFRAAQNCEQCAKIVAQQIKETRASGRDKERLVEELKQAYDAACSYYSDMGELGKAADALLKGAAACEDASGSLEDLKTMYLRACSLMEAQAKPHFAVDVFRKTLGFLAKSGLYKECLGLLARQIAIFTEIDQHANVHKCYLSETVVWLTLGDVSAADQAYMAHLQSDEYLKSDECALEEDLVRAFKSGNEELLQQTIRKQGFAFLDNQIGRLARKLSVYGGSGSGSASSARVASRTGSSGAAAKNPFAPSSRPAPPKNEYEVAPTAAPAPVAAAAAAPVAATATAAVSNDGEYDLTDSVGASMTVASEEDQSQSDFDFSSLQFASTTVEEYHDKLGDEQGAGSSAVPPPSAHVDDGDMLDLT